MSHLKAKIKRPLFRKLLYETLCIYEFPFNSGDRISKEKRIMEVLRIKHLKYDRNFSLIIYFNYLFFLFVLNKQAKAEVRKQPSKCVPREKINQGKPLKNNCEKVLVKL